MQIVARKDIDLAKWNQLVAEGETTPCDYSWYLDSVAENWSILVDENYSKGFAFTTKTTLKIENITVAPFVRQNCFYGEWSEKEIEDALRILKAKFRGGILQANRPLGGTTRSCQIVENIQLSSHATRNIKKAIKHGYSSRIATTIEPAFSIMNEELAPKIKAYNLHQQQILSDLLTKLQSKNQLLIREIIKDDKVVGGLFFFTGKNRDVFIKGSATSEAKKEGAMYLAMQQQIETTLELGKLFDFDGSEVPGVKRFNNYFGAKDIYYYQITWDKNPFWYRLIRKIYVLLK